MYDKWKELLWEYDKSKIKIEDEMSIFRILMFGDIADIRYLIKHVSEQKIKETINKKFDQFDKKTQSFCISIFGMEDLKVNTQNIYERFSENIPTRNIG